MSHGWGSNVLVSIQRSLLGVTPTGPGYSIVRRRAAGDRPRRSRPARCPTPAGTIAVVWRRGGATGPGLTLDLTVPANTSATISIPAHGNAAVQLGAGSHHFESS